MNESVSVQELGGVPSSLRVAIVTETYPPEINGVAITLSRLVDGLCIRGHRVQLVRPKQHASDSPTRSAGFEEVLKPGIAIPRYNGLKIGLPARLALKRLWEMNRPDVVHVATEGPLGWSALVAARSLKIALSTSFHTNFHSYSKHYGAALLQKPIVAYLRKFHNRAQGTMVPTESLRRELEQLGFRNVYVVSRGVDTKLFSPSRRSEELRRSWGADERTLVVLYVGRLAPEKSLPVLIESYAAMRRRSCAVKLVLVGDGPERAQLAKRLPEIIMAGPRTGIVLATHYASADAFLFPSLTETFGNVTLEAMASGLAVVAYDYAAAKLYIDHDQSGLLAPFGDSAAFVDLAAGLANEPMLAMRLRARARRIAEGADWETVLDDFEKGLSRILQQTNAAYF